MRIVSTPPVEVQFTCQQCKGVYALDERDIGDPFPSAKIQYGQHYATVNCPICGVPDFLSYDFFPKNWVAKLKEAQ